MQAPVFAQANPGYSQVEYKWFYFNSYHNLAEFLNGRFVFISGRGVVG